MKIDQKTVSGLMDSLRPSALAFLLVLVSYKAASGERAYPEYRLTVTLNGAILTENDGMVANPGIPEVAVGTPNTIVVSATDVSGKTTDVTTSPELAVTDRGRTVTFRNGVLTALPSALKAPNGTIFLDVVYGVHAPEDPMGSGQYALHVTP